MLGQPSLDAGAQPAAGDGAGPARFRFLDPDVAADAAQTAAAADALGPGRALACPVVAASPAGKAFGAPGATLRVPLAASAARAVGDKSDAACVAGRGELVVMHRPDDTAPWASVPAARVALGADGAARVAGIETLSGYYAIATASDDDGAAGAGAVSYTHLTLPTKRIV